MAGGYYGGSGQGPGGGYAPEPDRKNPNVVTDERAECMRLERRADDLAGDPVARYDVLMSALRRELVLALCIEEPEADEPGGTNKLHSTWEADMEAMRKVDSGLKAGIGMPKSYVPDLRPYIDDVAVGYNLNDRQDRLLSRFLSRDMVVGTRIVIDAMNRQHALEALRVIEMYITDVRVVLNRWHEWDRTTVFSFTRSTFTDADMEGQTRTGTELVRARAGEVYRHMESGRAALGSGKQPAEVSDYTSAAEGPDEDD